LRIWREGDNVRPRAEITSDRCVLQAHFRRCFPLTSGETFVSLAGADGKEVAVLENPLDLDAESKATLETELDVLYFTPVLQRILSLKQEASMWRWEVETQRGPTTFYLRGVRDSVHEVAPGRWQIYSVDGQRFEIRQLNELDARTQRLFESLF
jgi:hypothetical protein